MSILAFTAAIGASAFGAGLFLGAVALKPRVGPWRGQPGEFMPGAHTSQHVTMIRERTPGVIALGQVATPVAPALPGTVYVMTDQGLTPVGMALPQAPAGMIPAELPAVLPGNDMREEGRS